MIETAPRSTLYDAGAQTFDGPSLRRAMVARRMTTVDLARVTGISVRTVQYALQGRSIRDSTAYRILAALEERAPLAIVVNDR